MSATTVVRAARTTRPRTAAAEPLWFLRVNPLRRRRLADPALVRAVTELADAELAAAASVAAASDALFAAVARADGEAREALVALRRAVHHDRRLPVPLPAGAPAQPLADLEAARERRARARQTVLDRTEAGLRHERGQLADVLGDHDLRNALALVAPEVADAAERYRAALVDGGAAPARLLKSERGLLQYVSRALLRTSPLSRFTVVGLAVAAPDGVDLDDASPVGAVSFPSLDRAMLHYVLGGLLPPEQPGDWVQLPPTAAVDPVGGKVHFLRWTGGDGAPEQQSVRRMAAGLTGVVQVLVGAVTMGPRRREDVEAALTGLGLPAPAARTALDQALAVGMLCRAAGPESGVLDVGTALADPGLAQAHLRAELAEGLADLRDAPPERRRTRLTSLRSGLDELSRSAARPAAVIVQEDCVLPPRTVSPARFARQLDDLAAAVDLLSAFDRMHDVRALLATGFVERFGPGRQVPLAEHADALIADLLRRTSPQEATGLPAGPRDGSLGRLHTLRRRVWDALHADLDRCDRAGDDLQWSRSDATAAVADLPERFRRDPLVYGVLAQPAGDQLVLNDAYAGHGMLFGRFLEADRALGGDARDRLGARLEAVYGADGARVVEDLGLHRLNVNARPPVLRDRLRPEDWQRLRLVHDAETDALVVRDDDDRDVRVLNLGAGHPDLLPGPLRLAVWLVCGGRLMEDVVGGWHDTTGWDGRRTRRCPRVSVGQAVLARRRWYGGEELDRLVAAGAGPGELLVALTAWRVRHGVPEEVVLTDSPEYDYGPPGKDEADDRARRRKPQHLDLASALTARVLPRSADRRRAGHLEEALPGVAAGGHAREWVVEVGRAGGGAAFGWGGAW